MRTSVPHIYAAGDCAMPRGGSSDAALASRRRRKQHTSVALQEGTIAAAAAFGGNASTPIEYMHVPTAVCLEHLSAASWVVYLLHGLQGSHIADCGTSPHQWLVHCKQASCMCKRNIYIATGLRSQPTCTASDCQVEMCAGVLPPTSGCHWPDRAVLPRAHRRHVPHL